MNCSVLIFNLSSNVQILEKEIIQIYIYLYIYTDGNKVHKQLYIYQFIK